MYYVFSDEEFPDVSYGQEKFATTKTASEEKSWLWLRIGIDKGRQPKS
jgi:hypothetical protein